MFDYTLAAPQSFNVGTSTAHIFGIRTAVFWQPTYEQTGLVYLRSPEQGASRSSSWTVWPQPLMQGHVIAAA